MKHSRKDYAHIQDPTGKIGEDEPVFLLRAKDIFAAETIRYWADLLWGAGGDRTTYHAAHAAANTIEEWGKKYGTKSPDIPPED